MSYIYLLFAQIFSIIITLIFAENTIKTNLDINYIYKICNDDCLYHYLNFVQYTQSKNNEIPTFEYYLEYWWNGQETEEELLFKVCRYMFEKYPKKTMLRKNINKNLLIKNKNI
jgi:hypothetical protein